ncbi:hypothetical protein FHS61_002246 [Altererythrobacter atlanticus]|uniref:Uncharacterized protein n=1 Tax=Croceibacterium atlanticum TaxID=1267766 RepID=A0A0F7KSL6_9SPHN|nr:hypothetical protein [Croceibacterium atlanticum]AKH41755.1 hypothetical protein WYH_00700 [Croceibacterium atlanticum]MBB5733220.1 hypothetical protein [Croceibacterium atlanticum]
MLRQLLTVFAMLTGLAALAEPAQARIVDVENVGLTQQQDRDCAMQSHAVIFSAAWGVQQADPPRICPRPKPVIMVPPLMLQVDRAHE